MTEAKRAPREKRSTAEWFTFVVATAVLFGIVTLIGGEALRSKQPPRPVALVVGDPEARGDQYIVTVEVSNEGDDTAESVQVVATLEIDDETFEADQVIDFLSGGETEDLELVFPEDPDDGTLEVRVSSFALP